MFPDAQSIIESNRFCSWKLGTNAGTKQAKLVKISNFRAIRLGVFCLPGGAVQYELTMKLKRAISDGTH